MSETDLFSKNICGICLEKLTQCYLFREQCNETHQKLQKLYETSCYNLSVMKIDPSIEENVKTPNSENEKDAIENRDNENVDCKNSNELKFNCDQCGKEFPNKYYAQRHMKTHSDDPNLTCKVCLKKFTR